MNTRPPRLQLASLLLALPLALTTLSASAEPATTRPPQGNRSSSQPEGMVLHMEVRRVPVDIVVTDKQGNPVKGLTKDDFIVIEDKRPQTCLLYTSRCV